MQPDLAQDVLSRLRAHLREKSKDLVETVVARVARDYIDPAIHDAELRGIFHRLPLPVAHESRLRAPGDFLTVRVVGTPVLLVRDPEGQVRAFLNVCRHRGSLLESAPAGHRTSLLCPYHGWRYELDGRLANITARECFADLDTGRLGLVELPVSVCEGLIFVITRPGEPFDARQWLGTVAEHLASVEMASHQHFRTEIIETRFNWKIGVEGSLETYHFRYLHPATVSSLFTGMATLYDYWRPHQRLAVPKLTLAGTSADADPASAVRQQALLTYFIFPCVLVSLANDHLLITSFFPRGTGGCSMVYSMLTPAAQSTPAFQAHWERTWSLTRSVLSEDFAAQEGIQGAVEGGYDQPILFGRFEQALQRFRSDIDAALATAAPGGAPGRS